MYTDQVKGLMQVQKYKLGEAVFTRCSIASYEWHSGLSSLPVVLTKGELLALGATPLIESDAEIEKLDYRFDGAATEAELTVHEHKINELVDAVNALQKRK